MQDLSKNRQTINSKHDDKNNYGKYGSKDLNEMKNSNALSRMHLLHVKWTEDFISFEYKIRDIINFKNIGRCNDLMYFIPQNTTLTFATDQLCGIRKLIKGNATATPQIQTRAHNSLRWQTHGCPPSPSSTTTNNSNMDKVGTCIMAESFTKLDSVAMSALMITRCNYSESIVIKQNLIKHLICMACSCNLNEFAKKKARIIDALKVPHTLLRSQPEVKTLNSHPPG